MKTPHDVTLLPKAKTVIAVAAIAVAMVAGTIGSVPHAGAQKMRHDCCIW